ncbi:Lsr2 family protein [Corynebacterium sp. LK30]|uniref:histone-like nucleoid-structuring protein Lsr2 n=1 Tax=Corynebacterium TaxID=1716 RepID=UPI00065FF08B|nr:Lsr2 family protein [Corynebacterium sp. LK30]MBC6807323.1 Lsr2 family protein [Corynebacterium sp. LK30]
MARRELIQYIDDLDGTPLDSTDHQVVRFSFRGKNYILDLSQENAEKFEQVLEPYIAKASIDHSTVVAPRKRSSANPNAAEARDRNRKIRQWARENGMDVADRGALPKHIIEKYESAN